MPAKSKSQQRFFGMVDAFKKGKLKNASRKIREAAKHISDKDARDFARTKHDGLPEKKAAYASGFLNKCAEYGLEFDVAYGMLKRAIDENGVVTPFRATDENVQMDNDQWKSWMQELLRQGYGSGSMAVNRQAQRIARNNFLPTLSQPAAE